MPDVKKVNSGLLEFSEDQQVLVAIDEDGEVQKAVIIDEDGSETPIGTTPTGKITITENGTNIDVAQYATADVAVEGGSSDFSTAEVTVDLTAWGELPGGATTFHLPNIKNNAICSYVRQTSLTQTFEVVLYKGTLLTVGEEFYPIDNLDGDAVYNESDDSLTITGNCTITVGE